MADALRVKRCFTRNYLVTIETKYLDISTKIWRLRIMKCGRGEHIFVWLQHKGLRPEYGSNLGDPSKTFQKSLNDIQRKY